ncbi:MAG: hypothetical protein Q8R34_00180 [bacterium]|nr:hypothetical protein [bacterium]
MENTPQNPNQPEQYQVPPLEPAGLNQPSRFPKKLLVSIIILATLIGGYFALAKYQSWWPFGDSVLVQTPTPIPIPIPIPIPNEISDWKTYRNEKYGFELKYPAEWKIENTSNGVSASSPNSSKSLAEGGIYAMLINIFPTKSLKVSDEIGKLPAQCIIDLKYLTIDGQESLDFLAKCEFAQPRQILWIKNGQKFTATIYLDYDMIKNILSTFKFTR